MRQWKWIVWEENRRWWNLRASLIQQIWKLEDAFRTNRFNFTSITDKQHKVIEDLNKDIRTKWQLTEQIGNVEHDLENAKKAKQAIDLQIKKKMAERDGEIKKLKDVKAKNEKEWWVIDKKLWELRDQEAKIIVMTEWQKSREKELTFFAQRIKKAYKKIGKEITL